MEAEDGRTLEALLEYLRMSRGFDFTGYKRPSLARRVTKRVQALNLQGFGDYLDYLEVHPEEFATLFNTMLINVSSFFRDAPAWECLRADMLPKLLAAKPAGPIRVWSAGCAGGQEAYSLAIAFAELLGAEAFCQRVKIFATDVDEDALSQARQGSYSLEDLEPVPAALREKYFERAAARYVFRNELRRAIIFGRLDLIADAPISRLDLLACRNTLIYFNLETQRQVLDRFNFALNETGFLFLGRAEMLLMHANLFTPVNLRHRIFVGTRKGALADHPTFLAQADDHEAGTRMSHEVRLRALAIDAISVAQVVVDANDTIVLANEQVRARFGLSARELGRPLRDVELCYRPVELRPLLERALAERQPVGVANVERSGPDGQTRYYDVLVTPLLDDGARPLGVAITFTDVTRYAQLREELERSHSELETAYEELQSTNEELQTTNEELQSTVEELETTNEELQSSNEEMETMNAELQSTNEEVQTTNDQLRGRTDELNRANTFLESIVASMQVGVVVLDANLAVEVWNRQAEDLWGLRADEVRGKPFLNLEIGLPVEELKTPLSECMAGSSPQRVVLDGRNRRGKAIRCAVVCVPLAGSDKLVRGAILMMEQGD
jgi:two-component system, chemotaxis family, CheB/CheR fusion protein